MIAQRCPECGKRWKLDREQCCVDLAKKRKQGRVEFVVVARDKKGNPKVISLRGIKDINPFSLKDAQRVEAQYIVSKRIGLLEALDTPKERSWTLTDLVNWYLSQESTKAKASFKDIRGRCRTVCESLGGKVLGDIRASDLANYRALRSSNGVSGGSINNEIWNVRAAVRLAVDDDLIGPSLYNVFKRAKRAEVTPHDRGVTPHEFNAIYGRAAKHLRPILTLGYWTGCRITEALRLTWDRVDLSGRTVTLDTLKQRSPRTRTVPMAEQLFDELDALERTSRHVFSRGGHGLHACDEAVRSAVRGAGLKTGVHGGITFSSFRHTMVVDLRAAGVHPHVAAAITGHSVKSILRWYDLREIGLEDLRKAIEDLGSYRGNVVGSVVTGKRRPWKHRV